MAKKKSKRSSKSKKFSWVGKLFAFAGALLFKALPLMMLTVIIAGLFFGVRQALFADLGFTVEKIIVSPSDALPVKERQFVENQWLGKNILTVNVKDIALGLEKNPEIRMARVIRHLPSILEIEVQKRTPIAVIQLASKGSYGIISEDGMILDVVKERPSSLVLIEAYSSGYKEMRAGLQIKNKGFGEAVKFLKSFWDHPLSRLEAITRIGIDRLGSISVTLGGGPEIRLGRKPLDRMAALERAVPLLNGEGRAKIDYVDLQYDDVIVKGKK